MDFWEYGIFIGVMSVVLPSMVSLYYWCKRREEKKYFEKMQEGDFVRTRPVRGMLAFFLGIAILFFAITVVCLVVFSLDENVNAKMYFICLTVGLFFTGLGLFGYLSAKFSYVVANEEGVTVHGLFRKPKTYRYEEIAYYNKAIGGMIAYDECRVPLFTVNHQVGFERVAEFLEVHKSLHPSQNSMTIQQRSNEFRTYQKRKNNNFIRWFCFGFGIFCVFMFGLLYEPFHTFENTQTVGVLESAEKENSGDGVIIKLKDDERVFYVNSLMEGIFDWDFLSDVKVGEKVTLYIGYKYGEKYNLSQVEYNGKVYLETETAEQVTAKNDWEMRTMAWVLLGLGGGLIVVFVGFTIWFAVTNKNDNKKK